MLNYDRRSFESHVQETFTNHGQLASDPDYLRSTIIAASTTTSTITMPISKPEETLTPGSSNQLKKSRQKRYAPRSRLGCLTCRARKKRCDQGFPACRSCLRLKRECVPATKCANLGVSPQEENCLDLSDNNPSPSTTQPAQPHFSLNETPAQNRLRPGLTQNPHHSFDVAPALMTDQRIMLTYYIDCLIPKATVLSHSTSYLNTLYVPMAFESDVILSAIVARSATDLCNHAIDSVRRDHLRKLSIDAQKRCYHFLSTHVAQDADFNISCQIIAVVMLLIGLEVQNGNKTTKWLGQLACVRTIIKRYGGVATFACKSWEAECLYRHFLYYDVMSCILEGVIDAPPEKNLDDFDDRDISILANEKQIRRPWEDGCTTLEAARKEFNASNSPSVVSYTSYSIHTTFSRTVDPLMGLSYGLFLLIRRIGNLRSYQHGDPQGETEFLQLHRAISDWQSDSVYAWEIPGQVGSLDSSTRFDLVALAKIYSLAALILLHRRSTSQEILLPNLAHRIIALVSTIPLGGATEVGLTYPLFVAGAELTDGNDIEQCALRLRSIRDRYRFGNIQNVEDVLMVIWRERLNCGTRRDWEDVLREQQLSINLA